ncbi:MAG: alkaline phosphatase family protein [Candidatus Rokubacteria bacterium]|nr:alkaline phosphatase family protein [Candidatus Rokubacteria bacterium]
MPLDDLVLALQRGLDRLVRRLRIGPAPAPGPRRRLLIIQIDGLSRSVLEQALREGRMPFLARLLHRSHRMEPMTVGMPTSTPAFQMAAMYGTRPDIPGFHFHDKRRRADVYFPRAGDAALVEREQSQGRPGIVSGGSTYGCVFTGGALNNLFSFAMIKRPTGRGVLTALSALFVLLWVVVKGLTLSAIAIVRFLMRILANPLVARPSGWKWLAIKIGMSIWMRELFTLSASRDLYAGAPAVYVNYLDYDVYSHGFGPRDRRARRALRRVDAAMHQLWRVCRRVPEHAYDVYVLSDHGQAHCTPFHVLTGGRPLEKLLFEEFFSDGGEQEVSPGRPRGRHLASGIKAVRSHRGNGLFQRFMNYLDEDFGATIEAVPESAERHGIRVICAGPNAFVYFVDTPEPLTTAAIDARYPDLIEELSRRRGIGFVLARGPQGPVCGFRGKRYDLRDEAGPFAGRDDLPVVLDGLRDLMAMRTAGDLVIYGQEATDGDVSYIAEVGAHAGPSHDELHTFIVAPRGAALPAPILHPLQLYDVFIRYQQTADTVAA